MLLPKVKFLMFRMAEQIFAAMSFGLSWHCFLKLPSQIFHITFVNPHSGGHRFSTSSEHKEESQGKPTLKGRTSLLSSHSLENKHSVSLCICPQSDSRKFALLSLLVLTLAHISQALEVIPFPKFTCLIPLCHIFSAITKILSF